MSSSLRTGNAARPELEALALRCEREEPSRELEVAIFTAIGLTAAQESLCAQWCRMDGRTDLTRERYIDAWAPSYTKSLDAAVTLLPEEWFLAECRQVAPHDFWCCVGLISDAETELYGTGATEASARCAAALRARVAASTEPEKQ